MDEKLFRILYVFTDLATPLLAGYIAYQRGRISDALCNALIRFNIIVMATLLAVLSFWVMPLSKSLLWLPLFSALFMLVPGSIAYLTFARRHKDALSRGAYYMSAMLTNIGTIAGLSAFILYDEVGFAYVQIVSSFQVGLLVLVCFPLAAMFRAQGAKEGTRVHLSLRELFLTPNQVPVLGLIAGLALNVYGVERPAVFGTAFQALVHIGAWTALFPVGCLVDFSRALPYIKKTADLIPLRFLLTPLIFFGLCRLLFADSVLIGSVLLIAAAPTAINAVLTARLYKLNVDLTVASFLVTTVIYLLLFYPLFFLYVTHGGNF
ncbi:transporter [uncultured Selenomonas sp.]|uniref:AEC family transporter n=1 Tax=uncultured Selenomonas sp. TaxID=159275 RepID=UPI0028EC2F6A|nr:transporter [uncultured Selenomonas sp.]